MTFSWVWCLDQTSSFILSFPGRAVVIKTHLGRVMSAVGFFIAEQMVGALLPPYDSTMFAVKRLEHCTQVLASPPSKNSSTVPPPLPLPTPHCSENLQVCNDGSRVCFPWLLALILSDPKQGPPKASACWVSNDILCTSLNFGRVEAVYVQALTWCWVHATLFRFHERPLLLI